MPRIINIYCDESCHLEHDQQKAMVLGAVWCELETAYQARTLLRELKMAHGLPVHFEAKWKKVSPAKLGYYSDVLDYFFDNAALHFRALVVPDKSALDHYRFGQDHDTWYYKMYFDMLKTILQPDAQHRIFLDLKDTRGAAKAHKLHNVLCNSIYDFDRDIITRVQNVRSHEIELLGLTDLLTGVVMAANRGGSISPAKHALVQQARARSRYNLTKTTLLREDKTNIFVWRATGEPAS